MSDTPCAFTGCGLVHSLGFSELKGAAPEGTGGGGRVDQDSALQSVQLLLQGDTQEPNIPGQITCPHNPGGDLRAKNWQQPGRQALCRGMRGGETHGILKSFGFLRATSLC